MPYKSRFHEVMVHSGFTRVADIGARMNPPRLSGAIYRYVNGQEMASDALREMARVFNCLADDLLAPIGAPIHRRSDVWRAS